MKWIIASVEGQTEEMFCKDVINPYLQNFNLFVQPVIVSTKRVSSGGKFKGGIVSYEKAKNDVLKLLQSNYATAITTMYDLYHLPTDFPGISTKPSRGGRIKSLYIEEQFSADINNDRFHPYIQAHEFEALLYVSPHEIANNFPGRNFEEQIQREKDSFPSPEDINEGPNTSPSKRILRYYPDYDKPIDGTIITSKIGIDNILHECIHFSEWISWLRSL